MKRNSRLLFLFVSMSMLLGLASMDVWAQSSTGSVAGQVTDQQKAALVGAEIKLIDPLTNAARTTTSNDVGRYSFASVPP